MNRADGSIYQDLSNGIKPQNEKILLVYNGFDEYPEPDKIASLKEENLEHRLLLLDIQQVFPFSAHHDLVILHQ